MNEKMTEMIFLFPEKKVSPGATFSFSQESRSLSKENPKVYYCGLSQDHALNLNIQIFWGDKLSFIIFRYPTMTENSKFCPTIMKNSVENN